MPSIRLAPSKIALSFAFILGFSFLVIRALDPHRLSLWAFGDAQTLMAASVFRDEGFLSTHFLWVPQPASPIGKHIDDVPVRQHAHGSAGDEKFSGLGPKRIYTHWPSWYSIPYGILAKLGVTHKSVFQIWASLLSTISLVFLFFFLKEITGVTPAFFGTLLYYLSPGFLGYADSLATMPYDDFFRFSFLWAWQRQLKTDRFSWLPGILYCLSLLTTLDSVFFIPVAAIVSEVLLNQKIDLPRLAALILFGVLALGIQAAQNISYLGAQEAWLDWRGYFLGYGSTSVGIRLDSTIDLFERTFNLNFLPCLGLCLIGFAVAKSVSSYAHSWLWTLLLAGLAFPVIVPGKADGSYEIRQLFPYLTLGLIATLDGVSLLVRRRLPNLKTFWLSPALGLMGTALTVGNLHAFDYRGYRLFVDFPSQPRINEERASFLAKVKQEFPGPLVLFHFGDVLQTNQNYSTPGYGQVSAIEEAYVGQPVLTVPGLQTLSEDLGYFWSKTPNAFNPILLLKGESINPGQLESRLAEIRYPWRIASTVKEGELFALKLEPRLPTS